MYIWICLELHIHVLCRYDSKNNKQNQDEIICTCFLLMFFFPNITDRWKVDLSQMSVSCKYIC
jgi:hypothetical protein